MDEIRNKAVREWKEQGTEEEDKLGQRNSQVTRLVRDMQDQYTTKIPNDNVACRTLEVVMKNKFHIG